jgi:hypothetical protein
MCQPEFSQKERKKKTVRTYVIEVLEDGAVRTLGLENIFGLLLHGLELTLSLTDNPLKGTEVTGRSTLIQKVDIDVLRDGELASSDGLEHGGLSTTVLTQETVTTTVGEFEGGVGDEDLSVEHKGGGGNLDIARGGQRRQHTGGDTIRQTVLVHLGCELVDCLLVGGGRSVRDNGLAVGIELRLVLAALLGLLLIGTLGHTGSLRGGNHVGGVTRV